MKLYDTRIPIHETEEGQRSIDEHIETLDSMLNQYNIGHFFSLPTEPELEKDEKLCYWLHYQDFQNTEITLVLALFVRIYLEKPKQKILESIVKSFGRTE